MSTIRTIKLKRNTTVGSDLAAPPLTSPETADASPIENGTPQVAVAREAAPVAEPVVAKGATVSGKSYRPYAIAASVVVVLFLVMMGLQYSEISFYQADPSVWLKK